MNADPEMAERTLPLVATKDPILLAAQIGDIINVSLQAAELLETIDGIPEMKKKHPSLAEAAVDSVTAIHSTAAVFFLGRKTP